MRQVHIEAFGIVFLRISNDDIYHDLDSVLEEIAQKVLALEKSRKLTGEDLCSRSIPTN